MDHTNTVPAVIFIVPYRNRPHHKFYFTTYMAAILKMPISSYEIYFSHQCDARSFNRGATKNIGFLAVKTKYPDNYKDITIIFNDIDTIPFNDILNYSVKPGTIRHYYGFEYALGGIVAVKGGDFEKTNGFPNFWGWGMEDNVLQTRAINAGLTIDRSQFFKIGSPEILQLFDGVSRFINKKDPWRASHDTNVDGLKTIHKLNYSIDNTSNNPADNIHVTAERNIFVINILSFMTGTRFEKDKYYKYDLREPPRKIIHPSRIQTNNVEITDDWSNIPHHTNSMPRSNAENDSPAVVLPSKSIPEANQTNSQRNQHDAPTTAPTIIPSYKIPSKYVKHLQIYLLAKAAKNMRK